jgi:type I restriction enzyme S subunit
MGNLLDGFLTVDKLKYLPRDHPDVEPLLLRRGDVLFNRTNSAELVGKSAVFDQADDSMAFASYLLRVRFGAAVRPEWANIVINSPLGRAHVATVASQQVGQANVNGTKLKAFPLLVPPTDVQERLLARHGKIVDGVRRLTTDVSSARERGRTLRRALLQSAFSGRLTRPSTDTETIEELAGV